MTNTDFSAATYNILANAYIKPERYPNCAPEWLDPTLRRARLLQRIAALDVDILCLQEVEREAHDAIAERLGPAYRGEFAQRSGRPDGESLFTRCTWRSHEVVHYRAHNDGDDQVALIAHLSIAGRDVTVASTHLQWCPDGTPPDEHVGRVQLIELLQRRDESIWIIAGDMNATSQSCVIATALERGMALSAASQRPWDTTNFRNRPRKLDYLLYSKGRLIPHPGALPKLERTTPLPSLSEPSDHLALRVDYRFA